MGFLARLIGVEDEATRAPAGGAAAAAPPAAAGATSEQQALERYRYMLRTAPPETLEQAHAEAFARLSPEQRRQLLAELSESAPANERGAIAATPLEDTQALARVATRAEVRQPGVLERTLGSGGMGFGANLLTSFAMGFVGSMVAQSFFSAIGGFDQASNEGNPETTGEEPSEEAALAENESLDDADMGDDFGDFEV